MGITTTITDTQEAVKIYSVSELTQQIQQLIEGKFDSVWIEGEISNFRCPISGHYYMSLKDENAQIKAVMFRGQNRNLNFVPKDGLKVIAKGRIGIYAPRGEYQLIIEYIEPLGIGALALAFEQLKRKLAALGLFDQSVKKPIPFLPQKVAVITSPTGAAIRDFLKVIRRRFANLEITIVPVRVQGEGATEEIINAIELVNNHLNVDIIVLTRGGGSIEDLWAFNKEELAFAIRKSKIPVVSAVGHEIDWTISDFAADLRAPTPSAAAEILVKEKESLVRRISDIKERLISAIKHRISQNILELNRLRTSLKDPVRMLQERFFRVDELALRCERAVCLNIEKKKDKLLSLQKSLYICSPKSIIENAKRDLSFYKKRLVSAMFQRLHEKTLYTKRIKNRLEDLSPLSVLKRGYSITLRFFDGKVITDSHEIKEGEKIKILLAKGNLIAEVLAVEKKDE
ncbi:MAG: exodeoxyribonuclease VII large subunit [Deltaproteobacteria bacterium]|nr:MAG: exodeoxyribonuclease VII large subunit [Deltaproteobacteria bacterium]